MQPCSRGRACAFDSALVLAALVLACSGRSPPPSTAPAPPPPAPAPVPPPVAAAPDAAPAPAPTPQPRLGCAGDPPGPGYECVRDCGPPVRRATDPEPGWSWLTAEQARRRKLYGCPICLPADALISTPSGDVPISTLAPGALVWSAPGDGPRVARRVAHVASTPAPAGHRISIIELDDGRTLRASPGHPDAAGHPVGDLVPGDLLDGARVVRARLAPYAGHTYDLVLADGAHHYVSDGVRVRSSLPAASSR